jgi:DNA polymerase
MKNATVMWVGLSAKKMPTDKYFTPLHIGTNTGKLVAEIENGCPEINFHKTNLVNFPPLDSKGKLRYPTIEECMSCYPTLQTEIETINPCVVILLGIKTAKFVFEQLGLQMPKLFYKYQSFEHNNRWFIPIHHPSYIMVYRRKKKSKYVQAVRTVIKRSAS